MEEKYSTEPYKIVPNDMRNKEIRNLEKCSTFEQMNYHQAGILNPIYIPLKNGKFLVPSNAFPGNKEDNKENSSIREPEISFGKQESKKILPISEIERCQDNGEHRQQTGILHEGFDFQPEKISLSSFPGKNYEWKKPHIEKGQDNGKNRQQTGILYEDFDFLPEKVSLPCFPGKNYVWKRPHEIVKDPLFVSEGKSRFDVQQGALGNCWFIAPLANLCERKTVFDQVVPPDQNFTSNYNGSFRFHFWNFDQWLEIVVDDKLPTIDGQLVFMHSEERNEFWSALLEKAYAKFYGGYKELVGGLQSQAFIDMTGGLCEDIKLDVSRHNDNFFDQLVASLRKGCLMGCSINNDTFEEDVCNGLLSGHAYSITGVVKIEKLSLIRLRNPWGRVEWRGDWCDSSPKWKTISKFEKKQLQIESRDGEFWMSFRDFVSNFTNLEICHLGAKTLKTWNNTWSETSIKGNWKSNINAGGCPNYPETFSCNPQYKVFIEHSDSKNDLDRGSLIVGLQQKGINTKHLHTIGYLIYELNDSRTERLKSDYFAHNSPIAQSHFTQTKQICLRHNLKKGYYMILPCTNRPHEEGEFILRLFSSKAISTKELDAKSNFRENKKTKGILYKMNLLPSKQEVVTDSNLEKKFYLYSDGGKHLDVLSLLDLLNNYFQDEKGSEELFNEEICGDLVTMFSRKKRKIINYEEFKVMFNQINIWKEIYNSHDKNKNGLIDALELSQTLTESGMKISNKLLATAVNRFSGNHSELCQRNFIHCIVRLNVLHNQYISHKKDASSEDEFIIKNLAAFEK